MTTPPIIGNARLPLLRDKITVVNGVTLGLPVTRPAVASAPPPLSIDLELPAGIEPLSVTAFYPFTVHPLSVAGSPHSRTKRWRLTRTESKWSYDNGYTRLPLVVNASVTLNTTLPAAARAWAAGTRPSAREDNWQRLSVTVAPQPDYDTRDSNLTLTLGTAMSTPDSPHLLMVNDPGRGLSFLETYRRFGMNSVYQVNSDIINFTRDSQPSSLPSAAMRRSNASWKGLSFTPEHSTFDERWIGGPTRFLEVFRLDPTKGESIVRAALTDSGLSKSDVAHEVSLWRSSAALFAAHRVIDASYRGFFWRRSVEQLRAVASYSRPHTVFVDSEHWSALSSFLTHCNESASAQARMRPTTPCAGVWRRRRSRRWCKQ